MKKAVIIGYGSIGDKHLKVLKRIKYFNQIYIFSKRKLNIRYLIQNWTELEKINPDYFVISNESKLHVKTFDLINEKFKKKKIYIEKPLDVKFSKPRLKNGNKAIIGYNLRQHPGIKKLKLLTKNRKIINVEAKCSSFLPNWRNRTYLKTSTAFKEKCGGILYELSHEIDYINELLGEIKIIDIKLEKLSELKIDYEDSFIGIFKSKKCKNIKLNLNYFDKDPERFIKIHTNKETFKLDFISNEISIFSSSRIKKYKFLFDINKSYEETHKKFIKDNFLSLCNIDKGTKVLKLISTIYDKK